MNLSCSVASKELMFMRLWGTWCFHSSRCGVSRDKYSGKQEEILGSVVSQCAAPSRNKLAHSALGRHPSVHKMSCPGVKPEPAVMSDKEGNRRKEVAVRRKTYLSDVVWKWNVSHRLISTSLEGLWHVEEVEPCCSKWGATVGKTLNFCSSALLSVHSLLPE